VTAAIATDQFIEDPNYFRLAYQLAAMEVNAALDSKKRYRIAGREAAPDELLARGEEDAHVVIDQADRLLELYAGKKSRPRRVLRWRHAELSSREERLERFLTRTLRPSAALVLAGALRFQGRTEEADGWAASVRAQAANGGIAYRAYYNLACYQADIDQELALHDLREAILRAEGSRRAELIKSARHDPSLAPLRHSTAFKELLDRYSVPERPEVESG
jgi:hypothetical protein